jgi:hypothetical protein
MAVELDHGAVVFGSDIREGEVDVEERGVDGGMAHESLDNRERDLLTDEVGAEGVTESMGVGILEGAELSAMAEDLPQAFSGHVLAAARDL